jgi:hypothetical protein
VTSPQMSAVSLPRVGEPLIEKGIFACFDPNEIGSALNPTAKQTCRGLVQ